MDLNDASWPHGSPGQSSAKGRMEYLLKSDLLHFFFPSLLNWYSEIIIGNFNYKE